MEGVDDQQAVARICNNLAVCFKRLDELQECLKALRQGWEILRGGLSLAEKCEADDTCAEIGLLHLRLDEPGGALKMFNLVLVQMAGFYKTAECTAALILTRPLFACLQNLLFAQENGLLVHQARAYTNLGSCFFKANKIPEALESFTKGLETGLLDEINSVRLVSVRRTARLRAPHVETCAALWSAISHTLTKSRNTTRAAGIRGHMLRATGRLVACHRVLHQVLAGDKRQRPLRGRTPLQRSYLGLRSALPNGTVLRARRQVQTRAGVLRTG